MARTTLVCALLAWAVAAATPVVVTAPGAAPAVEPKADARFELSVIHLNDFHARFEQTDAESGSCPKENTTECVGGIARVVTMARELLKTRPNPLLLNVGDNFQGTLWFTLFKANITYQFLNLLPWNAVTLGNHEFDKGVGEAVEFINGLNSTMVVANLNTTNEPTMEGLFKKYVIEEVDGRKVGIIGIVTASTAYTSSPGKLLFLDERETVREQSRRLHQDEKVDIIILLSHAGIEMDQVIAAEDPYVDIIVGGHSHTLLYNPPDQPPGGGTAYATYPLIVPQSSGRKVAIVQAYAYTKYLGNLTAWFDDKGELVEAEGNPILLDKEVKMDAEVVAMLQPWEESIRDLRDRVVGSTAVLLEQSGGVCRQGECNLGSLVADAHVQAYVGRGAEGTWTRAAVGITNAGGLRTPIQKGNITYGELMTTLPFENTVDYIELQGKDLVAALEQAVAETRHSWLKDDAWSRSFFGMLHVSGLHVVYDASQPSESRLVDLKVLCHDCDVPVYEPVNLEKWYPIAINSFLVEGGDAFSVFKEKRRNYERGPYDYEVMEELLSMHNPVTQSRDGRISFKESGGGGGSGASFLPRLEHATLSLLVGALLWRTHGL